MFIHWYHLTLDIGFRKPLTCFLITFIVVYMKYEPYVETNLYVIYSNYCLGHCYSGSNLSVDLLYSYSKHISTSVGY